MKKYQKILAISAFVMFLLVASPVKAQVLVTEEAEREVLFQKIKVLWEQIAVLQSMVDRMEAVPYIKDGILTQTVSLKEVYPILSAGSVTNIKNAQHREYFGKVFEIFPDKYDEQISHVAVFTNPESWFDAYVETVPPKHNTWLYAAHKEVVADKVPDTELIIHELAHIVSYETTVGVPQPSISDCHEYFELHGCPDSSSYIGQFTKEFWLDNELTKAAKWQADDDQLELSYQYYKQHKNDFVSDYAAVGPEEDFAESLMFFVLDEPTVRNTYAEEKVDFLASYPELQDLRAEIQANI